MFVICICVWISTNMNVHLLEPHWFLTSLLARPFPTLHSSLCFYCPLQTKDKSCHSFTTQCLPSQHCYSSVGHYGHVLSAQGCTNRELLWNHLLPGSQAQHQPHLLLQRCYESPKSEANLKKLMGLTTDKKDDTNISALREEHENSC